MNKILLEFEKSMLGWCPKTSKFSGLPNYKFKPRKPVTFGTIFGIELNADQDVLYFRMLLKTLSIDMMKHQDGPSSRWHYI